MPKSLAVSSSTSTTTQAEEKVKIPPIRLIIEDEIQKIWHQLCP